MNFEWSSFFNFSELGVYFFTLRDSQTNKKVFKVETILQNSIIFIAISQILYNLEEPYIIINETLHFDLVYQQKGLCEKLFETLKPEESLFYTPDRPDLPEILSVILINKITKQISIESDIELKKDYKDFSIGKTVFCKRILTEKQKKFIFFERKNNEENLAKNHDKNILKNADKNIVKNIEKATEELLSSTIEIRLISLGISLIFNTGNTIKPPYELAYFSLKNPEFCLISFENSRKIQLKLKDLHIENNNKTRMNFPLVFHSNFLNKSCNSILNILLEQHKTSEKSLISIESFTIQIDDIHINLEKSFVLLCSEFFSEIAKILKKYKENPKANIVKYNENSKENSLKKADKLSWKTLPLSKITRNLFINHLIIAPILLKISYKSSPETKNSSFKNWYKTFHNIDNASFPLKGLEFFNIFDDKSVLFSKILLHYKSNLTINIFKMLGSIAILGNPIGLFDHFCTGVNDLFEKPIEGYNNKGPLEASYGLLSGINSFMRNTLTGTFNSLDKISSSFGVGIATLAFDEDYMKKQQISRFEEAGNVVEGLEKAGISLFKGFENGITGVFLKPLEGVKEEGVKGLVKGVLKGFTGFFVKPISAILDATSKTAEGLKNTVNLQEIPRKITRYKRPFYGIEKFYKEYSKEDAEIVDFLEKFKKGRFKEKNFFGFLTIEDEKNDLKFLVIMVEELLLLSLKKKRKEWVIRTSNIKRIERFKDGISIVLAENVKKIQGDYVRIPTKNEVLRDFLFKTLMKTVEMNKSL